MKECWEAKELTLPRLISCTGNLELQLFVDASQQAYGLSIYCWNDVDGQNSCNLIFAESRPCPMKGHTISRAELLAALIDVSTLNFVKKQLKWGNVPTFAWSDSCLCDSLVTH